MAASSQRAAGRQAGDGSVSPELLKQVIDGWDDQDALPPTLVKDLEEILRKNPNDVNFRIHRQPGVGYGTVHCLEGRCLKNAKKFPLHPYPDATEDRRAKRFGVGSLADFIWHQEKSEAHTKALRARLAAAKPVEVKEELTGDVVMTQASPKAKRIIKEGPGPKRKASQVVVIDDSEDENKEPKRAVASTSDAKGKMRAVSTKKAKREDSPITSLPEANSKFRSPLKPLGSASTMSNDDMVISPKSRKIPSNPSTVTQTIPAVTNKPASSAGSAKVNDDPFTASGSTTSGSHGMSQTAGLLFSQKPLGTQPAENSRTSRNVDLSQIRNSVTFPSSETDVSVDKSNDDLSTPWLSRARIDSNSSSVDVKPFKAPPAVGSNNDIKPLAGPSRSRVASGGSNTDVKPSIGLTRSRLDSNGSDSKTAGGSSRSRVSSSSSDVKPFERMSQNRPASQTSNANNPYGAYADSARMRTVSGRSDVKPFDVAGLSRSGSTTSVKAGADATRSRMNSNESANSLSKLSLSQTGALGSQSKPASAEQKPNILGRGPVPFTSTPSSATTVSPLVQLNVSLVETNRKIRRLEKSNASCRRASAAATSAADRKVMQASIERNNASIAILMVKKGKLTAKLAEATRKARTQALAQASAPAGMGNLAGRRGIDDHIMRDALELLGGPAYGPTPALQADLARQAPFGGLASVAGPSSAPHVKEENPLPGRAVAYDALGRPLIQHIGYNPYGAREYVDPAHAAEAAEADLMPDADFKEAFEATTMAHDFDKDATVEKCLAELGLTSLDEKLPNSDICLYAHQAMGVTWQLRQERSNTHGGILADEMGLGKTVQMISTMIMNPSDDANERGTLILAPVALLEQWAEAVAKFSAGNLSAHIYHGNRRAKNMEDLKKFDVVLTTVTTLSGQWVEDDATALAKHKKAWRLKKGPDAVWESADEADFYENIEQTGLLYRMHWHRVVVDEAQMIRNRNIKASRAVCGLKAELRWCLTGTPVTNSLADLYGLFRFLRYKKWSVWSEYNDFVVKVEKRQAGKAGNRAQVILKGVCLRRDKNSELNGKKLITLPEKHVNVVEIDFTPEEREIYSFVELRSQEVFNRMLKAGTVLKNYATVLVMLLRLRQLCSHPSLITEDGIAAAIEREGDAEKHEAAMREKAEKDRLALLEKAEKDQAAQTERVIALWGKEAFDRIKAKKLEARCRRTDDDEAEGEECSICFEPLGISEVAVLTQCIHEFCKPCLDTHIDTQTTEGEDKATCPKCRSKISKEKIFPVQLFEPSSEEVSKITGVKAESHDDYHQAIAQVVQKVKQGNGDDEADRKEEQMKRMVKKEAIPESDMDESDVDELASSPPKRKPNRARSKARKTRIVKSDDEDEEDDRHTSDDDFIDDSGVNGSLQQKTSKKKMAGDKGKGKARATESDIDEYTDDDSETEDDEPSLMSRRGVRVVNKIESKAAKALLDKRSQVLPSTKMMRMLQEVLDAPQDDKFLIISQWTSMLSLVSAYLTTKRVKHSTFDGSMSRSARDVAVKQFNDSRKIKCMLMSLKAGGVGLNLTGGNRVILLDLAWSPAVEAQAFDRVHRLGQRKEVYVSRLVIKNTVEDRILALQVRKQGLADASLGEGSGQKLPRLGVRELKSLFGL